MRIKKINLVIFGLLLGFTCYNAFAILWRSSFPYHTRLKVNNPFPFPKRKQSSHVANHGFHQSSSKETTHIAFLKVHKTASSTAQNVFLRFGASRNLTLILPHTKGESGWLNVISYRNSITDENIVPAPSGRHFDILMCHVIYNRKQFENVLPPDTINIGIVREPVSRFQSAIKYFRPGHIMKIRGDNPLSIYADNPLKYEPDDPRKSQFNNRMAVEFGFPPELFPGKSLSRSNTDIDRYLSKIDSEYKFIIISEAFSESMVYMKRLLNWKMKDILFVDKNVARQKTHIRKKLRDEDHDKIKEFLYLDEALYNFSVERFHKQISNEGQDLIDEVSYFERIRNEVGIFCKSPKRHQLVIDKSKWNEEFKVSNFDCKQYNLHEKEFIQKQRFRMYGTLNN